MRIFSATHLGLVRKVNEDRFFVKELGNGAAVVAVADGLGGHAAGERAAEIATGSIDAFDVSSQDFETQMAHLIKHANRKILEASAKDMSLNGMGTTLTAAFLEGGAAHWVHVGDSRLYLFRDGVLVQVTEDHTLAGLLLRTGGIGAEEARVHPARNMLMSCLGRCDFEADMGTLDLLANDMLLLSSDGLHNQVPEQDIADILGGNGSLEDKPDLLVEAALAAGGRDNITVVAAKI